MKLRFLFFYINPETNSSGYYRLENSKEGIKIAVEGISFWQRALCRKKPPGKKMIMQKRRKTPEKKKNFLNL
ncbi:hypothetical protein [Methanosarcina soligelidi]|uniref:hypothetical protein n=1 Tax=Methanosarcina soligelidi TaxID=1036677 RepID=UPI001F49259B|nr:hypothetical protein [Methanosarcina soligelidi]